MGETKDIEIKLFFRPYLNIVQVFTRSAHTLDQRRICGVFYFKSSEIKRMEFYYEEDRLKRNNNSRVDLCLVQRMRCKRKREYERKNDLIRTHTKYTGISEINREWLSFNPPRRVYQIEILSHENNLGFVYLFYGRRIGSPEMRITMLQFSTEMARNLISKL